MSSLEVLLAVAGFMVTALVVAGMILITPRGQVPVSEDTEHPETAKPTVANRRRRLTVRRGQQSPPARADRRVRELAPELERERGARAGAAGGRDLDG